MVIGERIRDIRTIKNLSQADIEKRSGMLRCYISRVENGHTVPSLDTLERFAKALEVPLHELFYEGELPPVPSALPVQQIAMQEGNQSAWGRFAELFQNLTAQDRQFLLRAAERLSKL